LLNLKSFIHSHTEGCIERHCYVTLNVLQQKGPRYNCIVCVRQYVQALDYVSVYKKYNPNISNRYYVSEVKLELRVFGWSNQEE
jgi:hypothetical protein